VKTQKIRLTCLSRVLVGRARDTSRSCRTGGDSKEGLACVQTGTLTEKRTLALDLLVKRLLSSIKKKQVP